VSEYRIILDTDASDADVDAVETGLSIFNRQAVGFDASDDFQSLRIFVKSDDGTVMGGVLGATAWGWLYISVLWMHDDLHGQGFGTRLMQMAEEEALKRNCHRVVLDTHSFQALPFYQKLGYTVFGELEDFPIGHTRYYLKKQLQAPDGA
jgi:GNAT superfamily N-acetyltransferase